MRTLLSFVLFASLAACAAEPSPLGSPCDPGCGDGLACLSTSSTSSEADICSVECSANDPAAPRDQCPVDSKCIATPSGVDACLAECLPDGSCDYGDPGYPVVGAPDLCICIPWSTH